MHPGTLKALEFDRIVEAVRRLALTPLGAARLERLRPATARPDVEAALETTTEAVRLLAEAQGFGLRAPASLDRLLDALAVTGYALEPLQLLGLASLLESAEQCAHAVRRAAHGQLPRLLAIASRVASFDHETADVRRAVDPAGEVFDHASPELRQIRDRLRRQRQRLRGTLESYVRGKDTAKYLQEQVITDRNGRYVLMVRAEHRGAIPGIVHGSSTSGASLFLEPLSTVEINNEIVALQEHEAQEVRRILLALTDAFRRRAADLARTIDAATDLDVAQAKARLAQVVDGIAPALSTDGRLELLGARHPLLVPAVTERLAEAPGEARTTGPVPVDIRLVPPTSVLMITGPNTGGKTVALKTAGLLALMAQAGLHVPVLEGSVLPVFGSVFADIGDEQSIAQNLSTFSWHMTNIAAMDASLGLPALVLLDEVGAGTDPVEGGALGMAIIEHFRARGALVVATTHYDALKTYASTTDGVASAAFGFTPDTFTPTYRLLYGSPGTSLALEIASKLGLPAAVIEQARRYRSEREAQLAEHLARVDQELHTLDHERRLLTREREQMADQESRFRAREDALRNREEEFRRRLDARLDERLRDARREIDAIVDDAKRRAAALLAGAERRTAQSGAPLSTGETGGLRADARERLTSLGDRLRAEVVSAPAPAAPAAAVPAEAAQVGDRVAVGPLGLEGVVQALHGREAEINVRGKRLRAAVDELRVLRGARGPAPSVKVEVHVQARGDAATDLNVIGCNVDEAVSRADKFLDAAAVAEQRLVRVIHGLGTGQLRRALAGFLQGHPLVARFGPAPQAEGGQGVTVVELKD